MTSKKKISQKNSLSESMINFLAYQILKGLFHCHKCKIAHIDIKHKNIVIDEYLNVKTIDFSVSIIYRDKKPNNKIKLSLYGTPFYIYSEIINSNENKIKNLNKVDTYSLGVLLYKLAFGCYPFI